MVKLEAKEGVAIASINVNGLLLHLDEIKCLIKEKDRPGLKRGHRGHRGRRGNVRPESMSAF